MMKNKQVPNVRVFDTGLKFCLAVEGLVVAEFDELPKAWDYIMWMHKDGKYKFTVGKAETPVAEWIAGLKKIGFEGLK